MEHTSLTRCPPPSLHFSATPLLFESLKMSPLPLPTSAELGLNEPRSLASAHPESAEPRPPASAIDLLAVLRQAAVEGNNPPNAIFHAVADAARALTGASGTAIALPAGGVVVCQARSGDIAPDLGSTLNVDSGFSGECFRISEPLRCDDAETDSRVDPDVCRLLGIRSIAAVPLCGPGKTIGLLEAFSGEANAFAGEQIGLLQQLGEIVEIAYRRQFHATSAGAEKDHALRKLDPRKIEVAAAALPIAPTVPREHISPPAGAELAPKTRHHYWILSAALALMLLASAIVWWTWHEPVAENSTGQAIVQAHAEPAETAGQPAPTAVSTKPSASIANKPDQSHGKGVLQNAAKIESAKIQPARNSSQGTAHPSVNAAPMIDLPAISSRSARGSPGPRSEPDPPTVVLAANGGEKLDNLSSEPTPLPTVELRVSQGVTEAKILRKVEPTYPAEAFTQRLSGTVTLTATIAEDGSVPEVKVLKGEPILAAAAVAAVRQWRYSPFLLNGKPIAVQKAITIIFKAP